MAVLAGAGAVAGPKTRAVGLEEGVAFAFERCDAGDVAHGETGLVEPAAEMGLLALAFGMMKAAEGDDAVADETGIGSKDHIRGPGLRFDDQHLGDLPEGGVELVPLLGCALARRAVDVAGHPGVNDIVNFVVGGRTHQERRLGAGSDRRKRTVMKGGIQAGIPIGRIQIGLGGSHG